MASSCSVEHAAPCARGAARGGRAGRVRRPVVLDGAVVVAEPEGERALVLGDGAPVHLVDRRRLVAVAVAGEGDGRGEHA